MLFQQKGEQTLGETMNTGVYITALHDVTALETAFTQKGMDSIQLVCGCVFSPQSGTGMQASNKNHGKNQKMRTKYKSKI